MSSFIRKIIIHCIWSIAGVFLVLFIIQGRYWNSRIPVIKQKIITNINPDTNAIGIILGSSHTFYGINSTLLDGVWYNLSSISQSISEDQQIIEYVDSLNINIKNIILPISYFTNFYKLYESEVYGERIRTFDYQHAYGFNYSGKTNLTSRFYLLTSISQFIWKKKDAQLLDDRGNLLRTCTDSVGKFKDIDQIFKSHDLGSDFSRIHPNIISIINFCEQRNIRLIFLVMPFTREYNHRIEKTKFDQFLREMQETVKSKNIRFLDERNFFNPGSESIMFQDPDHLSACGQEIFSKHLNLRIKEGAEVQVK